MVTRWRENFERDGLKASVKVRLGRGRQPSIGAQKVQEVQEIVHATLHDKLPGQPSLAGRPKRRARRPASLAVTRV
jgi:hypothetical protein